MLYEHNKSIDTFEKARGDKLRWDANIKPAFFPLSLPHHQHSFVSLVNKSIAFHVDFNSGIIECLFFFALSKLFSHLGADRKKPPQRKREVVA